MVDRHERKDEKGFTARYLILIFIMFVAACAVFFSLGFLVGYNERPSPSASAAEEVPSTGSIVPPPVNVPPETATAQPAPVPAVISTELPTEHVGTASQEGPKALPAPEAKPAAPAPKAAAKPAPAKSPASKSASSTQHSKEKVGFIVQVTASREKKDAEKLVKELKSRGFDVFVVPPQYSDAKDNLYRVQVGPYETKAEAVRVRDRIAKEGFKPFIKQ